MGEGPVKVYVFMGWYDYEGSYFQGVYSTREGAEAAVAAHRADRRAFSYDDYEVVEATIDGDWSGERTL